jgi:hypothetical protein
MIRVKPARPRTLLFLDTILFAIGSVHLTAGFMVNAIFSEGSSSYLMWHRALGFTGVSLFLLVGLHLLFHLPWINAQLSRLFGQTGRRAR